MPIDLVFGPPIVAHALVRAASALMPTPGLPASEGPGKTSHRSANCLRHQKLSDIGIVTNLPHTPNPPQRRRGSALLAVLWLTAALSAIAFSVASMVRAETERTSTAVDSLRAYYLATGSIY